MTNPLRNLIIDKWYKVPLVLGACVLVLALSVELKNVSNNLVQCVALGFIFIGIGEWINHPLQTKVSLGFKLTSYNRLPSYLGTLFDILGFITIMVSIWKFK